MWQEFRGVVLVDKVQRRFLFWYEKTQARCMCGASACSKVYKSKAGHHFILRL